MPPEPYDSIATIAQHKATAASLRRQAEAITDDVPQRADLETAALAYETIARQIDLSRARANEIDQLAIKLQAPQLKKT